MPTEKEIQQLKNRYDLRTAGAEMRDLMHEHAWFLTDSAARLRALDNVSNKMKGRDRLFFRQGFLFRAGEIK